MRMEGLYYTAMFILSGVDFNQYASWEPVHICDTARAGGGAPGAGGGRGGA